MAIRMRRGNYLNFDPTRMVAGEFAVCLDNGYVYMTLSPGNVIRLGTFEQIEEAIAQALEYSQESEAWAIGKRDGTDVPSTDPAYHNNSKYYAEFADTRATNADDSAEDSEAWAVGERGGLPVPSGDDTYQNNSKYYAQQGGVYYNYLQTAVEPRMPEFEIDWTTGELLYSGGYFTFWIDENGYIHWGVEQEG